jgi:spore maturation protein CgeB
MRILIVGREAPYSAEYFYKKAFSDLGNEVYFINSYTGIKNPLWPRIIHTRTNFFNFVLNNLWVNKHLKTRIDEIDPDAIIFFKGDMISTEVLSELTNNRNIYLLYPDTYKFPTLLRGRLAFFTATYTASNNRRPYYNMGARKVVTVPWACDPDFHKKMEIEKKYNTSFIGTAYLERRRIIRSIREVDVFGDFWYGFRPHSHPSVYGEDFIRTINQTKVNLNLQTEISVMADAPTMRTFEVAGCTGFQISDDMPSMKQYFPMIPTFKDIQDLKEKIEYYLDNKEEREEVALKCMEICRNYFKYTDSAKIILSKL